MADTAMQNTSKALYRYLCQNIVGTDHYVKTIRQMNSARDNATSGEFQTVITSGSFGEGLDMKGSDLDMMYVSKHIEVYEYLKPRLSPNITYLSMRTDDVKPGFTHLLVEKSDDQYFSKNCEEHNGIQYLSSSLYKQHMISKAIVQRQRKHLAILAWSQIENGSKVRTTYDNDSGSCERKIKIIYDVNVKQS
ncbi:unnamed protein product [Mytilus edulis]|uniref:Uncharacterized protein n=1 Tax=Mytilus edulis TaxID=6550 RepID=A0A8S3TUD3_MYTED|nr:unnamed protein product [Mytilus edulis]